MIFCCLGIRVSSPSRFAVLPFLQNSELFLSFRAVVSVVLEVLRASSIAILQGPRECLKWKFQREISPLWTKFFSYQPIRVNEFIFSARKKMPGTLKGPSLRREWWVQFHHSSRLNKLLVQLFIYSRAACAHVSIILFNVPENSSRDWRATYKKPERRCFGCDTRDAVNERAFRLSCQLGTAHSLLSLLFLLFPPCLSSTTLLVSKSMVGILSTMLET